MTDARELARQIEDRVLGPDPLPNEWAWLRLRELCRAVTEDDTADRCACGTPMVECECGDDRCPRCDPGGCPEPIRIAADDEVCEGGTR